MSSESKSNYKSYCCFYFDERGANERVLYFMSSESKSNYESETALILTSEERMKEYSLAWRPPARP